MVGKSLRVMDKMPSRLRQSNRMLRAAPVEIPCT